MRVEAKIALRYLFSRKKQNVINIISGICAGGICVATVALVCILSVYNGFQSIVSRMYSAFDSDLRISLVEGKTFSSTLDVISRLDSVRGIKMAARIMQDGAILKGDDDSQTAIKVCGVSNAYLQSLPLDSLTHAGKIDVGTAESPRIVIGAATAARLNANIHFVEPLTLYAPIHDAKVNIANPEGAFNQIRLYVSGIYSVHQQDVDSKYAFIPLSLARELFGYESNECTQVSIYLEEGANAKAVKAEVMEILASDTEHTFACEDMYEQHADFHRMLNIEKWITFLILIFVLMVAVVNIIGSLSMLIIEKRQDIKTLSFLGATKHQIQMVFALEGWFVTLSGTLLGLIIGLALCAIQSQFGLITFAEGSNFIVNAYPVDVKCTDIICILVSILVIGGVVAWIPARSAADEASSRM